MTHLVPFTHHTTTAPSLLTKPAVGEALGGINLATVDRLIAAGQLPVVRVGRRVFVRRSAVDAYIDAATTAATTGPLAGRKG